MSLTCQTIANDVNVNMREYFGAILTSGGAAVATPVDTTLVTTLFVPWIDQIQMDVLHTSIWAPLLRSSTTFTSSASGSPYALSPTNIRYITSVYDTANNRQLVPYTDINFPAGTSLPAERSGPSASKFDRSDKTNSLWPEFYVTQTSLSSDVPTVSIVLLPDPKTAAHAGTVRVFYQKLVTPVTSYASTLSLPTDARDVVVAGVTAYCADFLRLKDDATMWTARYEAMKKGLAP